MFLTRPVLSTLLALATIGSSVSQAAAQSDTSRKERRIPLTPELERSAFRDEGARVLLRRAREARLSQDSSLKSYDATSYMRVSVGLGIRRLGPERLLFRAEHAARVRWGRGAGVWVQPTGRRAVVPMGGADMDMSPATAVPYFPGREALWFPSEDLRKVREEVDERELVHPLARGAEAYYQFASGDSARVLLPDGRGIHLRELRITARRPDWRTFVGSFWFDADRGSLVRAAYRMAAEIDVWNEAGEDVKRDIRELEERLRTDTGKAAAEARKELERLRKESGGLGMKLAEGVFSPIRAKVSAITVEYGLYEGQFWLPKNNVFEGEGQAMFARVPVRYEESYRYHSVNGDEVVPKVPTVGDPGITADDTLFVAQGNVTIGGSSGRKAPLDTSAAAVRAREDSVMRALLRRSDSLMRSADSILAASTDSTAKRDSAQARWRRQSAAYGRARARLIERRREECARDSTYFAGARTVLGAYRMAIRLPCDTTGLGTSPDLPPSIFAEGEQLFSEADRDQLLGGLDFALQPGWSPTRPRFHMGLDLMRYNRVEGLSVGASLTSVLGLGYTARAVARFGIADKVPNGELSLVRSNGRSEIGLRGYHRLAVANDDWGDPLAFGASVANLLYARDEGFYYRSGGAELSGNRDGLGPLSGRMRWRLFAERQYDAGTEPNTQVSFGNLVGEARFTDNIAAQPLWAFGGATDFARSFGTNPRALRFDSRIRAEAALTDRADSLQATGYGRLVLDGTVTRPLAGLAWSLTGAAGSSAGDLPLQRAFFVGGLHTVRGQFARSVGDGRVGDTFWLSRAEVARGVMAVRLAGFYDVGWAGSRDSLRAMGRPLSGAGVGLSLLDGLFRLDVSRGIFPERNWRTDLYIGARF